MIVSNTSQRPVRYNYRWDLDKTYLDTDFRLHRIWRVPFESAAAKRNVPGAVALLRELSTGQDPTGRVQVTFISGSRTRCGARSKRSSASTASCPSCT